MEKNYYEHKDKVVEQDDRFLHLMAVTLNPKTNYKDGVIRCITSREGDVQVKGYRDRSELYKFVMSSFFDFKITERLNIVGEKELLERLVEKDWDCIGFEDPDIWIDPDTSLMHLYFTIPIIYKDKSKKARIHLGHAVGENLDSLKITEPVLFDTELNSAKEVSIAPLNKKGFRNNLIESRDRQPDNTYSVVKVAIAKDMNEPWEYGETVFHPKENNISWIGGHASPGPLFPRSFIDTGEGRLVGVINGREANKKEGDKTLYGMFSVGLFIYDYQNGKIDWVSSRPFIQDSQAKTITFASQFVDLGNGKGILYAHVDDSFVRAYDLDAEKIKKLLPK